MKKITILAALAFALGACSNDDLSILPMNVAKDRETPAPARSMDEAIAIAESLNNARSAENTARSSQKTIKSVEVIGSTLTRSESSADTLIYAINYENMGGFTLVSAARTGIAILGYTEEGNFDAEKAEENPNFSFFLDAAKEYVSTQAINPGDIIIDPSLPITRKEEIALTVDLKWGQVYPEGMFCPNGMAGCAQVASAIIMGIIGQPASISLTYGDRDVDSQSLDWSGIRKHKKSLTSPDYSASHVANCNATPESHQALGRLCRQIGQMNYATYAAKGTETYSTLARGTLGTLCPNNAISYPKDVTAVKSSLWDDMKTYNGIAYVYGMEKNTGSPHAWVCDAAEHYIESYKVLTIGGNYEYKESHTYYYRFNWGYCGEDNGYFAAGVFDTSTLVSRADYENVKYFVVSR